MSSLNPELPVSGGLFGRVASQTMLLPMAPQLLTEDERAAVAGAHFGFEMLGRQLYPDLMDYTERFGGLRTDAAMRAKVHAWLAGWVEPPAHYTVHHPVRASGQWWRLFRTTMFVEQDLAQMREDALRMAPERLESLYGHLLGEGARGRFDSHQAWWENTLAVVRAGSWHSAVYSMRHQAFISPLLLDDSDQNRPIDSLRAEWPRPFIRMYPTEDARQDGHLFDFGRLIYAGAMIEVLGTLQTAPPFGEPWGPGVTLACEGATKGLRVAGLIHAFDGSQGPQRRITTVSELPEVEGVALDGPDAFRLLQAIHAVTGHVPKGVPATYMEPERLNELVSECGALLTGMDGDEPLIVPKRVFEDALALHPGLNPVFGRVVSTL